MSDLATVLPPGSGASRGFTKRAGKIMSQAGLYTLVEDMAKTLDKQGGQLADIHAMCTSILDKLARLI